MFAFDNLKETSMMMMMMMMMMMDSSNYQSGSSRFSWYNPIGCRRKSVMIDASATVWIW